MANAKRDYPVSADALYAAFTDPDHIKRRAEAAGHRNVTVKITERGEGREVRIERDIEAEIPAFAKKVVNPVNHVVTVFDWRKSGDGWAGTYRADVNARIRIESRFAIRPAGSGSEYVEDYTAKVDVPLIGGKIASVVEKETGAAVKNDLEWSARELGPR